MYERPHGQVARAYWPTFIVLGVILIGLVWAVLR
jgi:hypothetical protein